MKNLGGLWAGSWFQRHSYGVRRGRGRGLKNHCQESNKEQKVGGICLLRQVCSPAFYLGGKMVIPKRVPTFRCMPLLCKILPQHKTCGWFFTSFSFSLFTLSGLILLISPNGVQPCTDAAIDDLLIHLVAERPFGWIYVPHFLCIINSVLWEKEWNVMARPPQRNVPIWEEEFYRGEQLTASQYSGHIFLYNCITTNDKWGMYDSWLRCLTATVLARGPWQALDFCSKWVKHIRHYEGTEASRMSAEMSDPGRLLGTQLAKQMSF